MSGVIATINECYEGGNAKGESVKTLGLVDQNLGFTNNRFATLCDDLMASEADLTKPSGEGVSTVNRSVGSLMVNLSGVEVHNQEVVVNVEANRSGEMGVSASVLEILGLNLSKSPINVGYVPLTAVEDSIVVEMPARSDPLEKWDSCLVGYFVDKGVGYNYLRNSAFGMWKAKGLKEVLTNGDGFMFFIFDTPDCCRDVLEGGPWIASAIGNPLFMDQLTARGSRVAFARICVEIEATSKMLSYFQIRCGDDAVKIKVEYPGLPSICQHCQIFGHSTEKCVSKLVAQLISLQKVTKENVNSQEEGWTTVQAKGKRKVGDPEFETIPEVVESPDLSPDAEPISASVVVPLAPSGQTQAIQEDPAKKSSSVEEVSSDSSDVDRFQKNILEIIELVIPNAAEMLETVMKETKKTPTKAQVNQYMKNKSSGKSNSSQRKKKRGLNNPSKQKEVKNFVSKENVHVMGVLETKIKQTNERNICEKCFAYCGGLHLGLILGIFGSKLAAECAAGCFIRDISFHRLNPKFHVFSWVIFNAIRYQQEKIGGSFTWTSENEEFNTYINASESADLSYGGCQFTWANKRCEGAFIATKIDRVLVNEAWLDKFPESTATFLPAGISDHSSVVVNISVNSSSFTKPFKYFDFWSRHPDFLSTISSTWVQYIRGVPMFRIFQKLRQLKVSLKLLNKKDFSDISTCVLISKASLDLAQIKLDKDPLNYGLQVEEREELKTYIELSKLEECLALQKSRVQWLGLGDRNGSFFFRSVKSNIKRESWSGSFLAGLGVCLGWVANCVRELIQLWCVSAMVKGLRMGDKSNINKGKIRSVVMEDGTRSTKSTDIHDTFVQFYTKLFGTPILGQYNSLERIQSLVNKKVSNSQSILLAKPISDVEIKEVFWSLKANKAPGPDGYSAGFFKSSWDIVGKEVTLAIKSFFDSGKLLSEINSTIIALIPKIPNPMNVGDYRPISCCNTIYKCIAKIIANRVKLVLPDLIDPVQSAFVQGRRISDDIFLS
ncbi:uncharacterized protein LOC114295781 [Camellia sinensis]|uniref:uncharacterized protein LOC114295781 n=1 Tax=Camellia sinensis TaxID=4442 RepID=UPI0010364B66|nr:uncharacterized protein LOC114295781 [Camellia sinensis]